MELRPGIEVDDQVLGDFARRHAVRRIAAFGSVLRAEFGPESDIDLLVEIVGEAAKQETKGAHPEVPWSAAARMRDRLVHHYFDIDLDVLWSTVRGDLPALLALIPSPASSG